MRNLIEKIKNIIKFTTHDIWVKSEDEYKSPRIAKWVHQAKILLYTIRGLGKHDVLVRSAALTFYTVMSIVPIAALLFGITKGFGIESRLKEFLYNEFGDYQPLIDRILEFANAMLERARGGVIAAVGVLVLFWSVMKVFGNIEDSFNNIWDVRKGRNLTRKITDYISVVVAAPLLLIASNSILLQLRAKLININFSLAGEILFTLLSLIMIWILFGLLYKIMPNTNVRTKSAMLAGIFAGTAFQIFQIAYFWIQSGVSKFNAIYGSFAAIPLFLIWIQASWQIVLFGAELSFAYENVKNFEYEKLSENISYDLRRKIMVVVMQEVARHYIKNQGPVSSVVLAKELDLPIRMVRDAVYQLLKAKLIITVNSDDDRVHYYVPASDVHNLTVASVIRSVENTGEGAEILRTNTELRPIEKIIEKFDRMISDSDMDRPLLDLPEPRSKKVFTQNKKP